MLSSEYSVPRPKTPVHNTTRDERLRAQTLFFDAGWSKSQIALQLNLTLRQVKYALRTVLTQRPFQGVVLSGPARAYLT